ncbi:hypothetical protein REPUB_Repub04eG0099600 [Reevesia pubescens]
MSLLSPRATKSLLACWNSREQGNHLSSSSCKLACTGPPNTALLPYTLVDQADRPNEATKGIVIMFLIHSIGVRQKVQNFLNAACTGNLDLLKKIATQLDEGKGLAKTLADIKDANKRGAIHFAAREGMTEVCKYLLEELKLDVDTKDEDGEMPLLHAAQQGHTLTAKYLLEHDANPAIPSDLGATALHHAAGIGNIELLKSILAKGVEVDSQSDSGIPLVWATGHAQHDAVKVLLDHHANPNAETEDNITPLLSAVATGSLACLDLLIQAGAKVSVIAGGATPLHIAADNGSPELINSLLKAGADPNFLDEDGQKPIQVAAARGQRQAVEILFPLTSRIDSIPEWTVDGVLEYMQSEAIKQKKAALRHHMGKMGDGWGPTKQR